MNAQLVYLLRHLLGFCLLIDLPFFPLPHRISSSSSVSSSFDVGAILSGSFTSSLLFSLLMYNPLNYSVHLSFISSLPGMILPFFIFYSSSCRCPLSVQLF